MTDRMNPGSYLNLVNQIAIEAGIKILEIYEQDFAVTDKQDGSPLTEADQAAHHHIVDALKSLTPDIPVLSEESARVDYELRRQWQQFWLVDPLDGTKEFVKRNGEFTVNIALIDKNRPVLGVVYAPVTGDIYYAADGVGAFKGKADQKAVPISVGCYTGGKATVAASRSHAGDALTAFLDAIAKKEGTPETLSMGSSLKLCLVAEGKADVYPRLGPTSEWDTAAAQCVVEVAGGKVNDIGGTALTYNKPSILNPFFIVSDAGNYNWSVLIKHDD